jgi:glyoxylase-like metal-dependent hydrolase (beta-lactamase superfamily II)
VSLNRFRSVHAKYLFFLILAVAPLASAQDRNLPPDVKISEASKLDKSQAGYYRMKIGNINVIALTDGTIGVDFLALLTNTIPGEVESRLTREDVKPTAVEASMNAYLIQLDSKLILVDTGAGELLGPKLDKLPDSLRSIGIQPEQITDILLTHIHPDHSGGLTVGGRRVFPNATVHVNKLEFDYWTNMSLGEKAPEPTKTFFQQANQTVTPYIKSEQVKTFDGEVDLFPGLRTVAGYGHTPGQTYYVLESNGEKLVFWGDTLQSALTRLGGFSQALPHRGRAQHQ